jgi:hypothetical protein
VIKERPDDAIKQQFDQIYKNNLWGGKIGVDETGGGSGDGSTIKYTTNCRKILYNVIKKYKIRSMIDAPCGSMAWIPLLLVNLTKENPKFRYYGVDVVESIVNISKKKYANYSNWQMNVLDFTQQSLPPNYDLIFTRDALQHLPLVKVADALKQFSRTEEARYLLAGSYVKTGRNSNINIGNYFAVDLRKPPFGLDQTVEIFDEKVPDSKHLVLYDIKNYLSKVNFDLIYSNINSML